MSELHKWERIDAWRMRWPDCEYERRNHSYRCAACGIKAGYHYVSHRQGWRWTKNAAKPCTALPIPLPLFK